MNNMEAIFRSVLEEDRAPVVLCAPDHTILYMNPAAAERYARRGGMALVGQSLRDCHSAVGNEKIDLVLDWFRKSPENNRVFTFRSEEENKDVYMIALRDENGALIGYYEKHEYRNREPGEPYTVR